MTEPLIPDIVLRDAYKLAASEVGEYREKFVAKTANIERVRYLIGVDYSHVPPDWIRERIPSCCKNPSAHGGEWTAANGHGPRRNQRQVNWARPFNEFNESEYQAYLDSDIWKELRGRALEYAERRCQVCNDSRRLEVHHRCYPEKLGTEPVSDLTVLCSYCHELFHSERDHNVLFR